MVDVTYSIEGANGDVIVFDQENYVLRSGIMGFGVPATSVRIDNTPGDGAVWRQTKRVARSVDLPVTILGTDRADVEAKLRRLNKILQDRLGPAKLKAVYETSTLYLHVHYLAGAETTFDNSEAGLTWATWVLQLVAPTPYWQTDSLQSFSVTSGEAGRGLLPQLTKLKLTSSNALGTVYVNNLGDVATYPTWTITGPLDELSISIDGQSFSFADPINSGEVITIDTYAGTVKDALGANRYAMLAAAPKLFSFPPGINAVYITGTGATSATKILATYPLRYEVIH